MYLKYVRDIRSSTNTRGKFIVLAHFNYNLKEYLIAWTRIGALKGMNHCMHGHVRELHSYGFIDNTSTMIFRKLQS